MSFWTKTIVTILLILWLKIKSDEYNPEHQAWKFRQKHHLSSSIKPTPSHSLYSIPEYLTPATPAPEKLVQHWKVSNNEGRETVNSYYALERSWGQPGQKT